MPAGRPKSSQRKRYSITLDPEHIAKLRKIAIDNGLLVKFGASKGEPNMNGAIIKILDEY